MSDKHFFVPGSCEGERCSFSVEIGDVAGTGFAAPRVPCGKPAEHKVEETIFDDDPTQGRHPLICYVCHEHFRMIMGPMADGVRSLQSHVSEFRERRER